jgi:hypothetical protein
MNEARRVIERLERIESLQRAEAPASALLPEVRGLLRDGEAWLAVEGRDTEPAAAALERCRGRLAEGEGVRPGDSAAAR